MPIITFKGNGIKETGNTSSAIATATYMAIEHNMKVLLISTSLNEDTIKESFWPETVKKSILPKTQVQTISAIQSGIEGLSRMVTSSKIEPRIIKDYTNVVLTGRYDVLLGITGDRTQYKEIQINYPKVVSVANQYYDMVIVDLDKRILPQIQEEILKITDVVVMTTCQKVRDITKLNEFIEKTEYLGEKNTLITIGRYDDYLKCNAKNVTRNIFRRRKTINTVPYNGKYYEAMQEGTVIDLFLNWLRVKNKKDHSYFFLTEVQRLAESINEKWEEVRMKRGI